MTDGCPWPLGHRRPVWARRGLRSPQLALCLRRRDPQFVPSLLGSAVGAWPAVGGAACGSDSVNKLLRCCVRVGSLKPHLLPVSWPPGASGAFVSLSKALTGSPGGGPGRERAHGTQSPRPPALAPPLPGCQPGATPRMPSSGGWQGPAGQACPESGPPVTRPAAPHGHPCAVPRPAQPPALCAFAHAPLPVARS